MSFSDTFSLLNECRLPLCSYIAFSKLRQMGYIVRRHHHYSARDGMSNRPLPAVPAKLEFPWDVAKSLQVDPGDDKTEAEASDAGVKPVIDGEDLNEFIIELHSIN